MAEKKSDATRSASETLPASAPESPSVGRIVHVGHSGLACAAIVAYVLEGSDSLEINASVILPYAITVGQAKIPFSESLKDGYWSWPTRK